MSDIRPAFHRVHNGDKAPLPFAEIEYEARLRGLRRIMEAQNVQAVALQPWLLTPALFVIIAVLGSMLRPFGAVLGSIVLVGGLELFLDGARLQLLLDIGLDTGAVAFLHQRQRRLALAEPGYIEPLDCPSIGPLQVALNVLGLEVDGELDFPMGALLGGDVHAARSTTGGCTAIIA